MRLGILIALLAGGCATTPRPPIAEIQTVHFVCGSSIRLDINHDGRVATLRTTEGAEVTMKRADNELGQRYQGGGETVLKSGDNYVYTARDGRAMSCELLKLDERGLPRPGITVTE